MAFASRRALGPRQQGAAWPAPAACKLFRPAGLHQSIPGTSAAPSSRSSGRNSGAGVLTTGRTEFDTVRDDSSRFSSELRWKANTAASPQLTSAASAIVFSVPEALSSLFTYSGEKAIASIRAISERATVLFTGAMTTAWVRDANRDESKIHMEGIMQRESDAQAQKAILRQTQRQVELLQINFASHDNSKYNFCRFIRERDYEIVALLVRLQQQRRKPGCLDPEHDPAVEATTRKVVGDEHVRRLMRENADLIVKMGHMEALLQSRASC